MTTTTGPAVSIRRLPKGVRAWSPAYLSTLDPVPHREFSSPCRYQLHVKRDLLTRWTTVLTELKLDDPTDASRLAAEARRMHAEAQGLATDTVNEAELVEQYTAGVPLGQVAEAAATAATRSAARQAGSEHARQVATAAAVDAQRRARRALYLAGDHLVAKLLAPEIDKVLKAAAGKAPDHRRLTARWSALHTLGAMLRGGPLSTVGGRPQDYMFRRPDLAHDWVLNHSEVVREHVRRIVDGQARIHLVPVEGAPAIDSAVLASHPEFGPGMFTAPEVLTHSKDWVRL